MALDVNTFDQLRIGLATGDSIRGWSNGEVKKPETINYGRCVPRRTGSSARRSSVRQRLGVLLRQYKRVRFKGIICERCGVEVTRSKSGASAWATSNCGPGVHIWYLRGTRSCWLPAHGTEARES